MKMFLLFLCVLLLFSCPEYDDTEARMNGIMIDCARLLEKHDYYYRLIDFLSEWDMNTLLIHFSDDHGISIALPGYENLAHPEAFTPEEVRDLVEYAGKRGIDVIPELEVFGHTRYITDHPDYHHLYVGNRSEQVVFSAVDPLNPETVSLMRSMIAEVAALFPSQYLHLGCDEVNLSGLGMNDKKKDATIWANYVNQMISFAHENGKTPMIWSDHVRKDPNIADMLNKHVVLVEWNYDPNYVPRGLDKLKESGFNMIIMAPSISCWRNRVIPVRPQLDNVDAHASAVKDGMACGMLNTVWLPMRYLQNSMWYGMAYGAWLVNHGTTMNLKKFHRQFVKKTFGVRLDREFDWFLKNWVQLHLDRRFYSAIADKNYAILKDPERLAELERVRGLSSDMLSEPIMRKQLKNTAILESMYLSTDIMYVLSEGLLILSEKDVASNHTNDLVQKLDAVIASAEDEWDTGRFPNDPAKFEAKFPNQTNSHLLIVLRMLKEQIKN